MTFSSEGIGLSLEVLDYQFPEAIDHWDGNWLVISGVVTHPMGAWRFEEACPTTFELQRLAEWLDGVCRGHPDPEGCYFTEPCLEFRYAREPEAAIEVILGYECAPPWLDRRGDLQASATLRFPVSIDDPGAIASAARRFLEQFPVRYAA